MKIKASLKYFFSFLLRLLFLTLIIFVLLFAISFINTWTYWKDFSQNAILGKNQMNEAINYVYNKDWEGAQLKLELAKNYFQNGQQNLESLRQSWFLTKFKLINRQINDLEYLNKSAIIISTSALRVANLLKNISTQNFINNNGFQNIEQDKKKAFIQTIIALEPELNGLKANLNLALFNLDKIQNFGILWPLRKQIIELKNQITKSENILTESLPIIRLLPAFTGYPQPVHYLIMLQNNDELRPTGGFLGSYVRLDIADFGKLQKLEASDIYHLDMPAIGKTNFVAPEPIKKYLKVDNWYLRDANWSPDWPQSAKQIQIMFQAESSAGGKNEPNLDGVFAITPDFVANLLRLTGPLIVRGETYAPENMQVLLQYNVEIAYKENNISSWDRKDIINELMQALKEKIINLPLEKYPELITRLNDSIKKGDILMYFNNPNLQSLAQSLSASGEIKLVNGDYLMIVDANLAAFKSDAVMQKNITYQVENKQNRLQANLKLNYYHQGDFDWRTTRYRSYTRILTPLGSELIKLSGIKTEEADIISYDDNNLQKHVFGFFWSIEPGQNKVITLEYYLPEKIKENLRTNNLYTLYLQKQPGSRINNLSFSFKPNKKIKQISPQSIEGEIKEDEAYFTIDLNKGNQALQIITN